MYRSVFIFVLFVLSASALTLMDRLPAGSTDPVLVRCANEHGLSQDLVTTKSRNASEADLIDPTLKCFVACMWRARGMLKEDGTLNAPLVATNLPGNLADRDGVVQAFTECSKEKGENVCETVSKTMVCLYGKEAFRSMHPAGTPFQD